MPRAGGHEKKFESREPVGQRPTNKEKETGRGKRLSDRNLRSIVPGIGRSYGVRPEFNEGMRP
jgi:hypothetical protein